jgi:hypothetical protein
VRRLLVLPSEGISIGGDERVEVRLLSAEELRSVTLAGL